MKVHQCLEMRVANGPADRREVVVKSANIKGAIEGFLGGISDCAINKKNFLIDLVTVSATLQLLLVRIMFVGSLGIASVPINP